MCVCTAPLPISISTSISVSISKGISNNLQSRICILHISTINQSIYLSICKLCRLKGDIITSRTPSICTYRRTGVVMMTGMMLLMSLTMRSTNLEVKVLRNAESRSTTHDTSHHHDYSSPPPPHHHHVHRHQLIDIIIISISISSTSTVLHRSPASGYNKTSEKLVGNDRKHKGTKEQ